MVSESDKLLLGLQVMLMPSCTTCSIVTRPAKTSCPTVVPSRTAVAISPATLRGVGTERGASNPIPTGRIDPRRLVKRGAAVSELVPAEASIAVQHQGIRVDTPYVGCRVRVE